MVFSEFFSGISGGLQKGEWEGPLVDGMPGWSRLNETDFYFVIVRF